MRTRLPFGGLKSATLLLFALCIGTTHLTARDRASIDTASSIAKLADEIDKLVDLPDERRKRSVGVQIISVKTGAVWFDLNGKKPLTPASTTKVLTSYASLVLFGPDYQIPTLVLAGAPVHDGVLNGDLYIRGHGDPLLEVNDIGTLADRIKNAGIRKIAGDIVGDGTYFDAITERMLYSGDDDHVVDLPPVSGLSIEDNMVTVVVTSPRASGQLCTVQTFPPSTGFTIINSAKSVGSSSKRRRRGDAAGGFRSESGGEDLGAGISISVSVDEEGQQVVRVSGTLGVNKTFSRRYEIDDPPQVVAGILYDRLRARGIAITGGVRSGATSHGANLIAQIDHPISAVLDPVMKSSHNHYAEFLFKMIGGASSPRAGVNTAAEARAAVKRCMEASAAPFDGCMVNDGSGLSRRNLIAPATLVATLRAAWSNPIIRSGFYDRMSIAGVDGTLRKRMKGTPAYNNVRGKTGTLRNVSALCGFVTTADGEVLAFAMLMNGYNIGTYKSVQNKVAAHLAGYSHGN